jgi:MFS transporter, DHA1 family, multidrug resistance protein
VAAARVLEHASSTSSQHFSTLTLHLCWLPVVQYHNREAGEKPYLNDDGHVDFAPDDIENPKNWSAKRRWYIAVVSISLVLNATYASSSPSGCLEGIAEEFGVSLIASGLVITLFLLGYCFGPLFFAPLSEFYGRRWIFYSTFVGYTTFNFLCAWAPNFGALLAGRFLSGTMASAALSNTPGVFADIFGIVERGNAMAVFSMITFAGPGTSPMISGFLQLTKDWRWSFYVLLWLGGISLVFLVTIPETHPATVLTNKARRIRRLKIPGYENVQSPSEASGQKLGQIFKIALTRPWIILFDPISFLIALYISVTYTLLYMLFSIYPIVFKEMRGWNSGLSETPLIGTVIGAALGSLIVFISSKKTAKRIEAGEEIKPEDRLPIAMIGGIGFTVTMFWFGAFSP